MQVLYQTELCARALRRYQTLVTHQAGAALRRYQTVVTHQAGAPLRPHQCLSFYAGPVTAAILGYIPSPPTNGISLGPLRLHLYGLMIAAGIAAAVWLAQRRWEALGGKAGTMSMLAVWGVPGGLVGARLYSVVTSWQADTGGHWYRAFEIWTGGLGIWGGVVGGIATGAIGVRRAGLRLAPLLDCVAPAFALAQSIGRWGNYFNQELYGWPSKLPWAVKISHPVHCSSVTHCVPYPPGVDTFQPTFLYESIWDLLTVGIVIWIERRFRIKRGFLIFAYAATYTFGRFFTEYMRVDEAHRYLGLRLNDWTSIGVFAVSLAILLIFGRAGHDDQRAGDPLPARGGASPRAQAPGVPDMADDRPSSPAPAGRRRLRSSTPP
jgi:prolipoprotein diacylglyceryl transferase